MYSAISSLSSGLQHAERGFASAARTVAYAPATGEEQIRAVDGAEANSRAAIDSHRRDPRQAVFRRQEAEAAAEVIRRQRAFESSAVALRRLDQTVGTLLDVEA
ncbi:MAG TPA: hypothetical protein PLG73_15140 [Candidatus Sumerlaeota bacterium]|nr:hypothetical protein [Candidatus Sumerlaeota bacterium]